MVKGIQRCDGVLEKLGKFYIREGYLPRYYNPYNDKEITDVAPTLTANCDRITNSSTVLIIERDDIKITPINRKGVGSLSDTKPLLVGGVGEINFGKQYRQGNRVYDANAIAMCLHAQPVGNTGGYSYLYMVDEDNEKESDIMTKSNERYNADEQTDFIQTEEEEWATEFAIREEEGNLDPIPPKEVIRTKHHEFTYVSLFSGIGGFEQALNNLGGTCVMASEIDKFAEQAYQAIYGHATVGDITKVKAEDVPDHDLLVGGFPCQSFSVAGKRKGFEDTRGTMFFEIARIASVKKPKILLLENVKGLVNHGKGRTLDTMIEILNEIGYVVDFNVLNSKYFGVPQNRERVFIVAVREDLIESEPFSEESMAGNTIVPKRKRQINEWAETFNFDWPQNDEVTTRLRDILEKEVDEKYYLSEDKTAKLVAKLNEENQRKFDEVDTERIVQLNGDRDKPGLSTNDSEAYTIPANPMSDRGQLLQEPQVLRPQRTEYGKEIRKDYEAGKIKESRHNMTVLQPRKDGISNTLTTVEKDNYLAEPQMLGHLDMKGNDQVKRVYSAESVSPTLTTMGGGHREPKIVTVDQTPVQYNRKEGIGKELEQANTLSASDWRGLNRNQNQNAVFETEIRPVLTPDRINKSQNGRRFKEDGEESFTLTSQDRHGVALREIIEENVREIASKSRPNEEIEINFKENGDIRPHRTDTRKSGLSELNINHEDNPSFTVSAAHSPKVYGNKTRYRIRKLTPLECFRLQGFSDEVHRKLVDEGISDSQRYKMAGNAVTVNVIDAIGEKLVAYL